MQHGKMIMGCSGRDKKGWIRFAGCFGGYKKHWVKRVKTIDIGEREKCFYQEQVSAFATFFFDCSDDVHIVHLLSYKSKMILIAI